MLIGRYELRMHEVTGTTFFMRSNNLSFLTNFFNALEVGRLHGNPFITYLVLINTESGNITYSQNW